MTKVEAIKKVLAANGGNATLKIIFDNICKYYPTAKDSREWQKGITGVIYREERKGKHFKRIGAKGEGRFGLIDYKERKLVPHKDITSAKELDFWFDIPALLRGSFLTINATNNKPELREKNENLLKNRQTGDWTISKKAIDAGLVGKLVLLFYRDKKGQSTIYSGTVEAAKANTNNKYRITIKRTWKNEGVTHTTFSDFFSGFKLSSNPTCIWIDGSDYSPINEGGINEDDLVNPKKGTTYMAWVAQRAGHDIFAKRVRDVWDKKCALTGLCAPRLLQACHLVPWNEADRDEKTNPHNGLLLCAHLHALLDSYLISFDVDGNLLIDNGLDQGVKELILSSGLKALRKTPTQKQIPFLVRHKQAAVNKNRKLILAT